MHIEEKHDPSADEVAAIERRLYEHNCQATGFSDGKDLGFVAREGRLSWRPLSLDRDRMRDVAKSGHRAVLESP
jgi:hypothetical protein